jgi:hypothetical protein
MSILVGLLALLALLAFVVWDRKRIERSPPTTSSASGCDPNASAKWQALAAISAMSSLAAITHALSPHQPPFSGRLSSLYSFIFSAFGQYGLAGFWVLVATCFAAYAFLHWSAVRQRNI